MAYSWTNGLPHGSVLASILAYNLVEYNLPETKGIKFQYPDGITIAYQSFDLEEVEKSLTEDLNTTNEHFFKWNLKPNPAKTEVYTFYLTNNEAKEKLKVIFKGIFSPSLLTLTLSKIKNFKSNRT